MFLSIRIKISTAAINCLRGREIPVIAACNVLIGWNIFSRCTCPEIAVPFRSSFQAFFFADLRRNKGFELAESLFFCLSQQKKARKEPFFWDM